MDFYTDFVPQQQIMVLSIPQIYHIGKLFWDDKYGTQGLSPDVIAKMRLLMTEDSINMPNNSFLLDVNASIFSVDEISRSLWNELARCGSSSLLLRQH